MREPDPPDLIAHIKGGSIPAFETLVNLYTDEIFNFLYRLSGSNDDAADLLQETFSKA